MNNLSISRRQFVSMVGAAAMTYGFPVEAVVNTTKSPVFLMPKQYQPMVLAWLESMREQSSGLLYYMDKGVAHFLSPLATAKTLIWAAKLNNLPLVSTCAAALVKAQQSLDHQYPAFSGAVASSYTVKNGQLMAGNYIYSSEQLVVLYALLEASQSLNDETYLKKALALAGESEPKRGLALF